MEQQANVKDVCGKRIFLGDKVAYATRSWGQHALKVGEVVEVHYAMIAIKRKNCAGKEYTAYISPDMVAVVEMA